MSSDDPIHHDPLTSLTIAFLLSSLHIGVLLYIVLRAILPFVQV